MLVLGNLNGTTRNGQGPRHGRVSDLGGNTAASCVLPRCADAVHGCTFRIDSFDVKKEDVKKGDDHADPSTARGSWKDSADMSQRVGYFFTGNCRSRARLSFSTLTRDSPRTPRSGPSVNCATSWLAWSVWILRALATRVACTRAETGLMCGSRPLPEAVTASAGIGAFGVNISGALSSLKALINFTSSRFPLASLNRSSGTDDS